MRTCPYCAEQIPAEVSVCPYCEKTSPAILNTKVTVVTDSLESLKAQKEAIEKHIFELNQEKLRLLENELRNETKKLEKIQDAIIQDDDEIDVQFPKTNTTINLPTDGCFPEGFTGHDYQDEVEGKQASAGDYSNVDHDHSSAEHRVVSHVPNEVGNYGKDPGDPDLGMDGKVFIWGIILLLVIVLAGVIFVASVFGDIRFSQPAVFSSIGIKTSTQIKTTIPLKASNPTLRADQQLVSLVCLPESTDDVIVYIYPDTVIGSPSIGILPNNQCYTFIDSSNPNWIRIDPRGWVRRTYLTSKKVVLNDDEMVDASGRVIQKPTPPFELPINVCTEGKQELRVGPAEYYNQTYTLYDGDCIILKRFSADYQLGGSDTGAWMPVAGIEVVESSESIVPPQENKPTKTSVPPNDSGATKTKGSITTKDLPAIKNYYNNLGFEITTENISNGYKVYGVSPDRTLGIAWQVENNQITLAEMLILNMSELNQESLELRLDHIKYFQERFIPEWSTANGWFGEAGEKVATDMRNGEDYSVQSTKVGSKLIIFGYWKDNDLISFNFTE
jgi:hypothetical protein